MKKQEDCGLFWGSCDKNTSPGKLLLIGACVFIVVFGVL